VLLRSGIDDALAAELLEPSFGVDGVKAFAV
jgi:hypothetical protein